MGFELEGDESDQRGEHEEEKLRSTKETRRKEGTWKVELQSLLSRDAHVREIRKAHSRFVQQLRKCVCVCASCVCAALSSTTQNTSQDTVKPRINMFVRILAACSS